MTKKRLKKNHRNIRERRWAREDLNLKIAPQICICTRVFAVAGVISKTIVERQGALDE